MSNVFRVLLTGSRSWTATTRTESGHTLNEVLNDVARTAASAGFYGLRIVHGACYPRIDDKTGRRPDESADWLAELWARDRKSRGWPVRSEPHPAAWKRYRKTAGYRRNAHMVSLGAHVCLAFLDVCQKAPCDDGPETHDSHGTAQCAELAERAGIHVQPFRPIDSAVSAGPPTLLPTESE